MMNKTKRDGLPALGPSLELLAARECRSLLRALAVRKRRQEGIHQARKSCRRLRSLLPLLPPGQPTGAVNRRLRELAHGLAPLRDAHIAAHTAKLLATAHETWITPEVIHALEHRCEQILDDALKQDPQWRQRRADAQRIITSIHALAWADIRPALAMKTLKRSQRRVKKAHGKALASRVPDALHRWRRRARKLRYQLEFVRKARRMAGMKKRRTQSYGARARQLSALTDQLGWRQDFQIFLGAIEQLPDSTDVRALRRQLPNKSASWSQAEPHT
ncbi:CHAD domain-containing protein [Dyella choica]|uniref:CHAD domain-containing protein n=1 Tax=Dyella choica TaxID=1927959 RepID=A0A432M0B7_9GAMM|nr:CHAD domain-containing protein [Dyella choica]RUL70153.1 CHAD domain-containing protein [Dyella choica]